MSMKTVKKENNKLVHFAHVLDTALYLAHATECKNKGVRTKYTPLKANWFVFTDVDYSKSIGLRLLSDNNKEISKAKNDYALAQTISNLGTVAISEMIAKYPFPSKFTAKDFD